MPEMNDTPIPDEAQRRQARLAYLLYLANLSFLPGVAFIAMLVIWRSLPQRTLFVNDHYQQTTFASIMAGVLLAMVSVVIVTAGGFGNPWTFVVLIIYFTLCHSMLLLLGVFGFTRANNGRPFEFFSIRSWRSYAVEEAVGKLWHKWITQAATQEYPEARVALADIQKKVALWFHAFGGDPGLTIKAATREQWQARRNWLARVAGLEWQVQLAWKNQQDLYLPGSIACFADRALNESLYLWLAALCVNERIGTQDWLTQAQQLVTHTLAQWPGLGKHYNSLVSAHIQQRPWPKKAEWQHQETLLRQALTNPGTVTNSDLDLRQLPPVPLWLHPFPPTPAQSDTTTPPADIVAESDQVSEIKTDHRRQGKKVDHSKEDEGLLAFRLESLFSWAEFVNVDRPQEEDEDLGAKTAADDLDEFAVSRKSGTVKQRLKF